MSDDLFTIIHNPPQSLTDAQLRTCYLHDCEWLSTHTYTTSAYFETWKRLYEFKAEMYRRGLLDKKEGDE